MDKCREEFEQYIRSQSGFTADFQIGCNGQYKSDLMHFMFVTFQHQQAKVEELEKEWLEMNQQHERAVKECFEVNAENKKLQKRVDAVKQLIQDYLDEEKELELKEWEQSTIYGRIAIELEQALKGEG